jgi:hypothetical protein
MTNDWNDFEDDFRDEDDNDLSPDHREHLNEASGSDDDEWEEEADEEEEEGDEEEEDEEEESEEDRRFREMDDDDKWRRGYFYTGIMEDY